MVRGNLRYYANTCDNVHWLPPLQNLKNLVHFRCKLEQILARPLHHWRFCNGIQLRFQMRIRLIEESYTDHDHCSMIRIFLWLDCIRSVCLQIPIKIGTKWRTMCQRTYVCINRAHPKNCVDNSIPLIFVLLHLLKYIVKRLPRHLDISDSFP